MARNSTTWTSSQWQSGETKTIRIPIALEAQIMAYARAVDSKSAVSQGNSADLILKAIAHYIQLRRSNRHPNQHSKAKGLDTSTRTWDELRKFQKLVEDRPDKLGL